jgi:hypothetical protein
MIGILILIALAVLAVAAAAFFVGIYNQLIQVKVGIDKSWANIQVLEKQRYDELHERYKRGELRAFISYTNPTAFYITYALIVAGYEERERCVARALDAEEQRVAAHDPEPGSVAPGSAGRRPEAVDLGRPKVDVHAKRRHGGTAREHAGPAVAKFEPLALPHEGQGSVFQPLRRVGRRERQRGQRLAADDEPQRAPGARGPGRNGLPVHGAPRRSVAECNRLVKILMYVVTPV